MFHNITLGQTIPKRMNEPKHKIVMIRHEIVLEVSMRAKQFPMQISKLLVVGCMNLPH